LVKVLLFPGQGVDSPIELQKFPSRKEARLYARIRRLANNQNHASALYAISP
jgi:hypothetical protein